MSFEILIENSDLIVVDKPHGWLSTPAREVSDPRPCLGRELQSQLGIQIFPVHRLDFEVSGVIMFAKTKVAHREVQAWFEQSVVRKTYQAYSCAGTGAGDFREWADWKSRIAKGKKRAFEASHGKDSITSARVIAEVGELWLWELMPLTGRSHQLRFEMAKHGYPIFGDELYGGKAAIEKSWMGLRAVELDFNRIPDAGRFGLPQTLRAKDLRLP
jgi:tRNA pseudouridine32 synthase / 23S rRNA pseudouridine746 synthase